MTFIKKIALASHCLHTVKPQKAHSGKLRALVKDVDISLYDQTTAKSKKILDLHLPRGRNKTHAHVALSVALIANFLRIGLALNS